MISKMSTKKFINCVVWQLVLSITFAVSGLSLDRTRIKNALSHQNLVNAEIGVEIRSIRDGAVIFSQGSRTPLIIASNNKVITTASALYNLGDEYKLETCLYAIGQVENKVLKGSLVVKGAGDPSLSKIFNEANPLKPLEDIAKALLNAGITRVEGALVIDDTVFDREFLPTGWPQDQLNCSYCAPVSGVSLMDNLVWLSITPANRIGVNAALSIFPVGAPFQIIGKISTTRKGSRNVININRPAVDNTIRVNGGSPLGAGNSKFSVTVRNPPDYFGAVFLKVLSRAGVHVEKGYTLAVKPPDYKGENSTKIGSFSSNLVDIVNVINKSSHNHCADQIFKHTGWKMTGKGTFITGEAASRKMFSGLGLNDIDGFKMADGSGLSRNNRFSAHTIASLLTAIYNSSIRDSFIRSLPISGMDGSLKKRLTKEPYKSMVRAKTGWISEVSALSGYARAKSGKVYSFSILFNGYKGNNSVMKSIQDEICRVIVDSM